MSEHKIMFIDAFKPLFIYLGALAVADLNTLLSTAAGVVSLAYSVIKLTQLTKEIKNNKKRFKK